MPACVKDSTAEILIQSGWATTVNSPHDFKDIVEKQVQKMVSETVALYENQGINSFEIITSDSANLRHGQLYPFVLDPEDIAVVAHGSNPDRIGVKSVSLTESDRPYEQILEDLKKNDETWIEYVFVNPDTGTEHLKKSWLYLYDDYIFGSGYYFP